MAGLPSQLLLQYYTLIGDGIAAGKLLNMVRVEVAVQAEGDARACGQRGVLVPLALSSRDL